MSVGTVLVADRSMAVRAVLRRMLEAAPDVEVVAEAADGAQAVRLAVETAPKAIVLDFNLPTLNGRALVEKLVARTSASVFVLTPRRNHESTRLAMTLHTLGAVAVFPKPEIPEEWSALGRTLGETMRDLGSRDTHGMEAQQEVSVMNRDLRYVAVGASTGGPGAVYEMLSALGRPPRVGVAIVQHIAQGFERAFTEWLTGELGVDVSVAGHGEHLDVGRVRIAPSGQHLLLDSNGTLRLDRGAAPVNGHRPAVDVLFHSLLDLPTRRVAAVLLSGMGSDGAAGMAELRRAGVLTIVQNEASCAVFGMPRAAIEGRAAAFALAPAHIGRLLARGEAKRGV